MKTAVIAEKPSVAREIAAVVGATPVFCSKARSEADYLVGINGSQALSISANRHYSLRRQKRCHCPLYACRRQQTDFCLKIQTLPSYRRGI